MDRSARYVLLGRPSAGSEELWFVLHGYRQLAPRFARRFRELAGPRRPVVAPEALNRFYIGDAPGRHGPESRVGGTWMTREDREAEIRDYVAYLDRLESHVAGPCPPDLPRVVLGFSQGAHTAARWVAYGRVRPRALVLWAEVLPSDLDAERTAGAFEGLRILSVQGREDAHVTRAHLRRQAETAEALGASLEVIWHPGGHVLEAQVLGRVATLLEE